MPHHLVIVPHTHWDREWYRTHEEFRYRLIRLLDGLMELLEEDPDFEHFTLDGQAIVLDDYLEVRPESRDRLIKLIRDGRVLVGPWYVLPDEWLVSGEALVRNLRVGLERASELGGAMRLGYVPDQFGHVGQLPQVFAGFGFDTAVLWRGVGRSVSRTLFHWEAPDGTRLLTVYLRRGYGNAAHLPLDPVGLAERLAAEIGALEGGSDVPSLLLMNGSDHLEPQPGLPAALAAAADRLPGVSFEIGTLPGFTRRARSELSGQPEVHRGELRSGLRAPLLPGCASARIQQKQSDFGNDRLLTRYLEPLAAWLGALGGEADPGVIQHAWRIALQNHPHDSICGCSVDAVHEQMEPRFARVRELATAHLQRTLAELGARVRSLPGTPSARSRPGLVVWNPGSAGALLVEGEVELDVGRARHPRLHLVDARGARIPLWAERMESGATLADYALQAHGIAAIVRGFPPEFMGLPVVQLAWRRRAGRLEIDLLFGAEAAPGFDFSASKAELDAVLKREGEAVVRFRARRPPRFRLRFVDALPGCGLRVYRLGRGAAGGADTAHRPRAETSASGGAAIWNDAWRVEAQPSGQVDFTHRASGAQLRDAVRIVSEGDRGDEYNFDPVPYDPPAQVTRARVRLLPTGEGEAGLEVGLELRVARALAADRASRSERTVALHVKLQLRLAEGLDRVDLRVELDNTAQDHRLRAHLRAPGGANHFEVESAFEVATRPIAPEPGDFGSERPAERPIGATPQRSFATLSAPDWALTVANRGSSEVEAVREPDGSTSLAVTLLRAVGWLSRGDLALRPGHAGPPLATPGAQVPGRHVAELSCRIHPSDDPTRAARAHGFAHPPLVFAGGAQDGPLADGARLLEIEDPAVVVSAIEPRRGGGQTLRLVNLSPAARRTRIRWHGSEDGELDAVDLAGVPTGARHVEPLAEGAYAITLRPWQIVSFATR